MPRRTKSINSGNRAAAKGSGKFPRENPGIDGLDIHRIEKFDRLRPFLISIASSSDLWMFISSTGALTAGRRDADSALFPYYTEDKIHDSAGITGPKTIFAIRRGGKTHLWEPFSQPRREVYSTRRNLYKSVLGNRILFEEINEDLGLAFRHGWVGSEKFGWVRQSWLENLSASTAKVRVLDGIQNILPSGVQSQFQLEKSVLVDAYKKSELIEDCGLALYLLGSIPVDRPEPAEALRATTVWSAGIARRNVLLSARQLEDFRHGKKLRTETDVRATRGAYFIESEFTLKPWETRDWVLIADVDQGPARVANLRRSLRSPQHLQQRVEADIRRSGEDLRHIVASADGVQKSARPIGDARHFNNVLCNVMRGGIPASDYQIDAVDLMGFVRGANREVAAAHERFFNRLGKSRTRHEMLNLARQTGDANLERICHEYLPLTFSRRHGDPSRPWNRFSIPPRGADGRRVLNYEGNWRDIFQNWEALAVSFPGFGTGMICKFVNASTADGYNPYRVTRAGFDWEVHDPQNPWSHIGYWGDHQIVYLSRLLEVLWRHDPNVLRDLLTREIFSFANLPYRIKPFAQLIANPRETLEFDADLDRSFRRQAAEIGSDGKLLRDECGQVHHANLTEKILIPILAKLANFIPGAGIWLNTQRPEWNDANNALVGNGVSVVTLCQLRRHLEFCNEIFASADFSSASVSDEVAEWLTATTRILKRHLAEKLDPRTSRQILDALGHAAEIYRQLNYSRGFSGRKVAITKSQLAQFLGIAICAADKTIRANRRNDGLYHSYNLVEFDDRRGIVLRRLYEMLEGQAAILSANCLSPWESLDLLRAVRRSALYRSDQHSYVLYPDRRLPRFTEKNNLPASAVAKSRLLKRLLADGNDLLIERDGAGVCHFNPAIINARELMSVLSQLSKSRYAKWVREESDGIENLYEKQFDHRSFTGRSGTFFGYEGLGSIYWHMVSKFLLAAQESFLRAVQAHTDDATIAGLAECYHDIREGIGDFKTPGNYGAFPMDPYSHTPADGGARQPGLTGQVKEDILCRFGELGVSVERSLLQFRPMLLHKAEFLSAPSVFDYCDLSGRSRRIHLEPNSLAFTHCQTPVIYQLGAEPWVEIHFADGRKQTVDGSLLDEKISRSIFDRQGAIARLVVQIPPEQLL